MGVGARDKKLIFFSHCRHVSYIVSVWFTWTDYFLVHTECWWEADLFTPPREPSEDDRGWLQWHCWLVLSTSPILESTCIHIYYIYIYIGEWLQFLHMKGSQGKQRSLRVPKQSFLQVKQNLRKQGFNCLFVRFVFLVFFMLGTFCTVLFFFCSFYVYFQCWKCNAYVVLTILWYIRQFLLLFKLRLVVPIYSLRYLCCSPMMQCCVVICRGCFGVEVSFVS